MWRMRMRRFWGRHKWGFGLFAACSIVYFFFYLLVGFLKFLLAFFPFPTRVIISHTLLYVYTTYHSFSSVLRLNLLDF